MQSRLNLALLTTLREAVVVPVLTILDVKSGVALARALVEGGLPMIEITLRTPQAIEALHRIKAEVAGVRVGAGTVLTPELASEAIKAGASFIVAPGMTPRLLEAAETWAIPFLPGAATASEAMALSDLGYRALKFFPAEPAGGVAYLKALAAPLPDLSFCPTGGIGATNAADYLALATVPAVGGSWVAPARLVEAGDWASIRRLAQAAAALRPA